MKGGQKSPPFFREILNPTTRMNPQTIKKRENYQLTKETFRFFVSLSFRIYPK